MEMLNTLDVNIDTEKLIKLFDQSYIHLIKGFIDITNDFTDLYKHKTFNIYVNDWSLTETGTQQEIVENCRKMMLSNTKSIVMKCLFLDLIDSDKSFSSFSSNITIELDETEYTLIDGSGEEVFTNTLNEQMSTAQIKEILEAEVNRHKDYIHQ